MDNKKSPKHWIPCEDHLGNIFPSKAAMLRHYNIPDVSYRYRINKLKWSLEKTLTTPTIDSDLAGAMECKDHLGNKFISKRAMCDYWRIPRHIFFRRISDNWDLERALTAPLKYNGQRKMIEDHQGNKFINVDEMCRFHNITKEQYLTNIRNNCDIETALTVKTTKPKHPKDHLGNEYRSINEMCKNYGITKTTLRSRLELGWTLREILENPQSHTKKIQITDHEGNKFETQKEMLEYHNISYSKYKHRMVKMGKDLSDSLQSKNLHQVECEDHKHNKFETIYDMLIFWDIENGTYYHKMKHTDDMHDRLIVRKSNKIISDDLTIIKEVKKYYWYVIYKNHKYVWHDDILFMNIRREKILTLMRENNNIYKGIKIEKPIDNYFKICYNNKNYVIHSDELFKLLFFKRPNIQLD